MTLILRLVQAISTIIWMKLERKLFLKSERIWSLERACRDKNQGTGGLKKETQIQYFFHNCMKHGFRKNSIVSLITLSGLKEKVDEIRWDVQDYSEEVFKEPFDRRYIHGGVHFKKLSNEESMYHEEPFSEEEIKEVIGLVIMMLVLVYMALVFIFFQKLFGSLKSRCVKLCQLISCDT